MKIVLTREEVKTMVRESVVSHFGSLVGEGQKVGEVSGLENSYGDVEVTIIEKGEGE